MFEYIATLVGMHETDKILMVEAQAKESNKTAIVQMATPNLSVLCNYRDPKKIKECLDAKFKLQDKTSDPYADMWDKDWINKKD
jgi:hypothetical protein